MLLLLLLLSYFTLYIIVYFNNLKKVALKTLLLIFCQPCDNGDELRLVDDNSEPSLY